MIILLASKYGQFELKETDILPRVGDKVCIFYVPPPTVSSVLLWPDDDIKRQLGVNTKVNIDAIVMLD